MSEREYLTFCPHCDSDLRARMFRNHCERFFNPVNNTWQRSISLNVVNSDNDDDNDELHMEMMTVKVRVKIIYGMLQKTHRPLM